VSESMRPFERLGRAHQDGRRDTSGRVRYRLVYPRVCHFRS
jgi:hypothetical protein